jgi:hypothetical protein
MHNINSRWNYLAVGWAAAFTILGAIVHNLLFVALNLFFTVWNWYIAEAKRKTEDAQLLAIAQLAKEGQENRTNND